MSGSLALAIAHARHHGLRSSILVLCVFVAALLPLATRTLSDRFGREVLERARSTPLLAGAKGSRFDLVMAGLYFRRADLPAMTMTDWRMLADEGLAEAIPLNVRFTARGRPLVATSSEYFDARGLEAQRGGMPVRVGEVVLGANAAADLKLKPGDTVFSDQRELYNIATPPALKLTVTGVLARAGTPDDDALFTDIKTAWALEGLAHAHADAADKVPGTLVLERSPGEVVVSEELVEDLSLTSANQSSFHVHADPATLPLSAVLLMPRTQKDVSILKAKVNAGPRVQVVAPEAAVGEMLGYVARVQSLLDALALVVIVLAGAMIALVTALAVRVRAREIETLSRIGVSRGVIIAVFAWEIAALSVLGLALAFLVVAGLRLFPPDLVKFL
jgi:putative ABC transport system permease protein